MSTSITYFKTALGLGLFLLFVCLVGCSTPDAKIYAVEQSTHVDVKQITPSLILPNLNALKQQAIREGRELHIHISHGIGSQDQDYANAHIRKVLEKMHSEAKNLVEIKEELLSATLNAYTQSETMPSDLKKYLGTVWPSYKRYTFTDKERNLNIKFHSFYWAKLGDFVSDCHISHFSVDKTGWPQQCATAREKNDRPAYLNAKFQDFVRSHLSDAITYGGDFGSVIRNTFYEQLCQSRGAKFSSKMEKHGSFFECDLSNEAKPPIIAFITHSLGSKIVTDALLGYDKDNILPTYINTMPIFMLANQLTLLSINNMCDGGKCDQNEIEKILPELLRKAGKNGKAEKKVDSLKLQLVAYNDPNDLLSFEMPINTKLPPSVTAWNISLVTTPAYLGFIANPIAAHNNYWTDDRVITSIVCGVETTPKTDIASGKGSGTCPALAIAQTKPH